MGKGVMKKVEVIKIKIHFLLVKLIILVLILLFIPKITSQDFNLQNIDICYYCYYKYFK
jgi:competence protein ComGC